MQSSIYKYCPFVPRRRRLMRIVLTSVSSASKQGGGTAKHPALTGAQRGGLTLTHFRLLFSFPIFITHYFLVFRSSFSISMKNSKTAITRSNARRASKPSYSANANVRPRESTVSSSKSSHRSKLQIPTHSPKLDDSRGIRPCGVSPGSTCGVVFPQQRSLDRRT